MSFVAYNSLRSIAQKRNGKLRLCSLFYSAAAATTEPDLRNFIQHKFQSEDKNVLPQWLRSKAPTNKRYFELRNQLKNLNLSTVCQEAKCPNIGECWSDEKGQATATIMIMGDTCTRACRFCNVKTSRIPAPLDPDEPKKTAAAIKEWNIDYVVVTSVDRDDLEDFGSEHFAETIREIRMAKPKLILEVLIPDFQGREDLLAKIVRSKPHVISHNLETIQRLQGNVRDYRASYERSLNVLKSVKSLSNNSIVSKTSLMLGLGETDEELKICFSDLRKTAVDCLTLGQYMRPSSKHLKVKEYVRPEKFKFWKEYGKKIGFIYVASGPNVRSSYKAGEYYLKNLIDN